MSSPIVFSVVISAGPYGPDPVMLVVRRSALVMSFPIWFGVVMKRKNSKTKLTAPVATMLIARPIDLMIDVMPVPEIMMIFLTCFRTLTVPSAVTAITTTRPS